MPSLILPQKSAHARFCPDIVSQDVVATDILEMAFCETAWKAALKAWDSKTRDCRSPASLISETVYLFVLLRPFKVAFGTSISHS
jgi:hypothetical protein